MNEEQDKWLSEKPGSHKRHGSPQSKPGDNPWIASVQMRVEGRVEYLEIQFNASTCH